MDKSINENIEATLLQFRSANGVPVERATVTRSELRLLLARYGQAVLDRYGQPAQPENWIDMLNFEYERGPEEGKAQPAASVEPECGCEACQPNTWGNVRMIVCAICGNKRCPHATDHRHGCTGSNEPGQKGSSYEHCAAPAAAQPSVPDILFDGWAVLQAIDHKARERTLAIHVSDVLDAVVRLLGSTPPAAEQAHQDSPTPEEEEAWQRMEKTNE